MKKNLHPTVRQVVFKDVSGDFSFLGTSTMDSKETIKWEDGKSYPLIKVEYHRRRIRSSPENNVFPIRKVA